MANIALKRSRQVPAEQTPAFAGIAERFRRAGDLERAITLCREGLQRFPNLLSARVTLGWALLDTGQYDDARTELEQVLRRAPDNLAAIRGLAELHDRSDGAVSAMETWQAQQEGTEPATAAGPTPAAPVKGAARRTPAPPAPPAVAVTPVEEPGSGLVIETAADAAMHTGLSSPGVAAETPVELESAAASAVEAAQSASAVALAEGATPGSLLEEWTDADVTEALDRAADAVTAAVDDAPAPHEVVAAADAPVADVPEATAQVVRDAPIVQVVSDAPAVEAALVEPAIVAPEAAEPVGIAAAAWAGLVAGGGSLEPSLAAPDALSDVIRALAEEELELEAKAELIAGTETSPAVDIAEAVSASEVSEEDVDTTLLAQLEALVPSDDDGGAAGLPELGVMVPAEAGGAPDEVVALLPALPPAQEPAVLPLLLEPLSAAAPAIASLPSPVPVSGAPLVMPVRQEEPRSAASRKEVQIRALEGFLFRVQQRQVQLRTQSVA